MAGNGTLWEAKEVRLSDGPVRYKEVGTGEPVIFLHGIMVNGDLWRKVVPALSEGYRCLVLDLPLGGHEMPMDPGADLSPPGLARLVAEFLDALGLQEATVVANDTGGAIAQVFVASYPERVSRLVLTNTDAFENFYPPVLRPLQWGARFVPGFVTLLGLAARVYAVRWVLAKMVTKHGIKRRMMDSYIEPLLHDARVRHDFRKVLAGVSNQYTLEAAKTFPGFEKPVLVAWGHEDWLFRYRYAERLADTFPNTRLERVPDAHAFVPEDNPERLIDVIFPFLSQTEPTERMNGIGVASTTANTLNTKKGEAS